MKRLAGIAAVAILAVGAPWWLRAGTPRAASALEAAPDSARNVGAVEPPRPPAPSDPSEATASPVGAPELTEGVRRRLDESVARFRDAARGCLERHTLRPHAPGAPDETLERVRVRVKVVAGGGVAAVTSVEKVEDGFGSATLERCVLDAVRAARWETGSPDGSIGLEHTLYIGELMERDPRAPPRRDRPPAPSPPPPGAPPPSMPPPPSTAPRT